MKKILLSILLALSSLPAASADGLDAGFKNPPDEARPWVYWFWLNGNITNCGITADLEAMQRVGLGGALIMEVDQGTPVGPVDFMGTPWRNAFRHVHAETKRLGLEINMNNDAGWNGSGGPWVQPEQSMQEVTWSETSITGPLRFEGVLPQPGTVAGYYRDIAVQAIPATGDFRIPSIESKASFQHRGLGEPTPDVIGGINKTVTRHQRGRGELTPQAIINPRAIIPLTTQMAADGLLVWNVPPGKWTILRIGHTSTGSENAPAPKSGRGLECDKLGRAGIEAHFAGMMAKLASDTGIAEKPLAKGLVATHIDSWENGSQNWTSRMREEFQQRRGYDLIPFLPVFTGRVVDSLEVSERFLWDVRRTVSDLVIENYAGRFRELANTSGIRFSVEAYGCPCDAIPLGGQAEEPMGEFWTPAGDGMETCTGMASAGHVYGRRIIGAEAFTADDQERWRLHPALLKAVGDRAFTEGINRIVFHRYAMQPWAADYQPGMMMGPWGQHYERTQTWWEQSRPWHEYLARCQFMLRQGVFVADICYLQPEAPPLRFSDHPRLGYKWDECSDDAVLKRMSVRAGRIVLPDGMSYSLLVLPDTQTMTPQLLRKVKKLVESGATVLGPRPLKSPSLSGYPQCDEEVRRLGLELWGDCDGQSVKEHAFGRGRVVWGMTPEQLLHHRGLPPDFTCNQPWRFTHRSTGGEDIYFVANGQPFETTATCAFRVAGKVPELWSPETGRIERAGVYEAKDGLTRVALTLGPGGSVFVVFRKSAGADDPVVQVRRKGMTLLSAVPQPSRKILVRQANYGAGDPARTRDVTAKVQRLVDAGDISFPVTALAVGDDPAPNIVKTLVVAFTVDDEPFVAKGRDGDTLRLGRNASGAKIDLARYGVLNDPARTRDVRDQLQRLLDAGETGILVSRMAADGDPANGIVKTLQVDYSLDGKPHRLIGTDPETVNFLTGPLPPEAVVQIHCEPQGGIWLESREAGEYEVTTASGATQRVSVPVISPPVEVTGPWDVRFDPERGGPERITLEKLISWSQHSDPGVKFYSGTATYIQTLRVPEAMVGPNRRLFLDLGRVQVMARVSLNGKDLGILWKPPFRVDITGAVIPGDNLLEVQATNLLINRMIGDEQLPEDSDRTPDRTLKAWPQWVLDGKPSPAGRLTFASWRLWKQNDPLQESGLLGPVTLHPTAQVEVKSEK